MSGFILLVDDDPDVLDTLKERFEIEGFRVITCRSYLEALSHMHERFEGVVVTDVRMPGKSGLELVESIKKIDATVPVIVMTGFAETETVVKAMQNGAVTVFEKPCETSVLLEAIREGIQERSDILKTRVRNAKDAVRKNAGRPPKEQALSPQVNEFERELIMRALKRNNGNRSQTASDLQVSRSQFYAKLKALGIE